MKNIAKKTSDRERTENAQQERSSIEKLQTYIKLGIMPGVDLMITFELPGGGIDWDLAKAAFESMMNRIAA